MLIRSELSELSNKCFNFGYYCQDWVTSLEVMSEFKKKYLGLLQSTMATVKLVIVAKLRESVESGKVKLMIMIIILQFKVEHGAAKYSPPQLDAAVSDVLASAVVRALLPPRNDTAATTLMQLRLLIFVLIKATDICANIRLLIFV